MNIEDVRIGFGSRFGAAIIDVVLVSVLAFILGPTIGAMIGAGAVGSEVGMPTGGTSDEDMARGLAVGAGALGGALAGLVLAIPILGSLYFLMEAITGFTLGKLMLGIQIANEDGSKAEIKDLMIRFGIKNLGLVLGLIGGLTGLGIFNKVSPVASLIILIGCFFVLGAAKQAIHDKVAKTAVFLRRDLAQMQGGNL